MSNYNDANYSGWVTGPGRWEGGCKLGRVNAPPIMQRVDATLPHLFQETPHPSRNYTVIPAGRILAAKATDLTAAVPYTTITLANGVDPFETPSFITAGNFPIGYTETKIMRDLPGLRAAPPVFLRHETIELPYTTINESYNNILDSEARLKCGEWLMPFYGSHILKAGKNVHQGKLVRWVEKKVYSTSLAATGAVRLASAPYPAFKPRILQAWRGATMVTTGAASIHYSEPLARWVAEFGNADITTVWYEFGASANQRIAQCVGIEPIGTAGGINASSYDFPGWLKWVGNNFGPADFPVVLSKRPNTSVTLENVTLTSNVGTLANFPVVPWMPISVTVTGSVVDEDGVTTTWDGEVLALADTVTFQDYTQGRWYDIDMMNGQIRFPTNVTVTALKVSYYYETDFQDGLQYDGGMLGLTDGSYSGVVGIPPHLDVAGGIGAMRVMIL